MKNAILQKLNFKCSFLIYIFFDFLFCDFCSTNVASIILLPIIIHLSIFFKTVLTFSKLFYFKKILYISKTVSENSMDVKLKSSSVKLSPSKIKLTSQCNWNMC